MFELFGSQMPRITNVTFLKMAIHQHMTANPSRGHTYQISITPFFMQFEIYHYYPVKIVNAKNWLSPTLTIAFIAVNFDAFCFSNISNSLSKRV